VFSSVVALLRKVLKYTDTDPTLQNPEGIIITFIKAF
jgi:hypothetical protein